MKDCNQCAMCCKLLDIPGFAAPGKWCPHAVPGQKPGCCRIYDDRPPACVKFRCAWHLDNDVADDLRPDRCRVILEFFDQGFVVASVEPSRPYAWRKGKIRKILEKAGKEGLFVWAVIGKSRHLILTPKINEAEAHRITKEAYKQLTGI